MSRLEQPVPTLIERGEPRLGWRGIAVLAMLFAFMLINFADKAVLGVAAGPIMQDLGISPSQYGLISSVFFLVFSLSAMVVGFLTVRFPTRRILLVMILSWTVAQMLVLMPAAGFGILLFSRMILGAGEGPSYGTVNHAAMKWFPRHRRGIATTLIGVSIPAGTALAAPVVGQLIGGVGWRGSFAVLGVVGLVWAIVWLIVGREGPYDSIVRPKDRVSEESAELGAATPGPSVGQILRSRTFIAVAIGSVVAYWSVVMLLSWVPPYLATVDQLTPQQVGTMITLPWGVQVASIILVGGVLSGWLRRRGFSTRVARTGLAGAMVVLAGIILLLFVAAPVVPVLKSILLALAFGVGACMLPMSQVILDEICPSRTRGAVLGILVSIYSFTGVVAPLLTGAVVEQAPTPEAGYNAMFIGTGVLMVVGGLICALWARPTADAHRLGVSSAAPLG